MKTVLHLLGIPVCAALGILWIQPTEHIWSQSFEASFGAGTSGGGLAAVCFVGWLCFVDTILIKD